MFIELVKGSWTNVSCIERLHHNGPNLWVAVILIEGQKPLEFGISEEVAQKILSLTGSK